MVRITTNALVIEIPANNSTPMEVLSNMQGGLIDLIAVLDLGESPSNELQNGLWHLRNLLQQMRLSESQSRTVNLLLCESASSLEKVA